MSTRRPRPAGSSVLRIGVLASIVLLAGLAETIVVLQGIVPKTSTSIVVEAPLYPKNFYYYSTVDVHLGRGVYDIVFHAYSDTKICIVHDNTVTALNATRGTTIARKLWLERGFTAHILVHGNPYQTRLVEVRAWRHWK